MHISPFQNGASRIKCDGYPDKHTSQWRLEEHTTCLQSTGICMYKAGKTSPNILTWRSVPQDRKDGQQNKSSDRISRLRRAHTSEQHKNYDSFWHNSKSATDLVFTKSKVKPKTLITQ
jgi:hypothetical protein